MNIFAFFCITCVALMAYSLLAFDHSVRTASKNRKVTNMEERSGADKFHFYEGGFKFDMSRSTGITANITRSESKVYDAVKSQRRVKSMVMVDNETKMPFFIQISEYEFEGRTTSKITAYHAIANEIHLIDTVGNIRAYKVDELSMDDTSSSTMFVMKRFLPKIHMVNCVLTP